MSFLNNTVSEQSMKTARSQDYLLLLVASEIFGVATFGNSALGP